MTSTKKLTPGRDALKRYLDEIGDSAIMTDAEEQALAVRIGQGDQKAVSQLVEANLRYVVTIARQYLPQLQVANAKGASLSTDDLISEGNIGMIKAAARFSGSHDKRFVTFAAPYIRQAIEAAIPNFTENTGSSTLSTDESLPVGSNNNFTLLNIIEDQNAEQADAHLVENALSEEFIRAIDSLSEREQAVIRHCFGIDCERLTMMETAMELGLKRERIRQIRDKALRKIRKAVKS